MPRTVRQQTNRQLNLVIMSMDSFPRRQFQGYDLYFVLTFLGNKEEPVFSDYHSPKDLDFSDELFSLDLSECSQNGIAELALYCNKNDKDTKLAVVQIPLGGLEINKHSRLGFKLWLIEGAPLSARPIIKIRFALTDGTTKISSIIKKKAEPVSKYTENVFLTYRSKVTDEDGYLVDSAVDSDVFIFDDDDTKTNDESQTNDEDDEYNQKVNKVLDILLHCVEPKNWEVLYDPDFVKYCLNVIVEETGGILKQSPEIKKYLGYFDGDNKLNTSKRRSAQRKTGKEEFFTMNSEITLTTLPELPENPPKFVPNPSYPPLYSAKGAGSTFSPSVAPVFIPNVPVNQGPFEPPQFSMT